MAASVGLLGSGITTGSLPLSPNACISQADAQIPHQAWVRHRKATAISCATPKTYSTFATVLGWCKWLVLAQVPVWPKDPNSLHITFNWRHLNIQLSVTKLEDLHHLVYSLSTHKGQDGIWVCLKGLQVSPKCRIAGVSLWVQRRFWIAGWFLKLVIYR